MTVSYENSKAVFQGIKDAGITSLSALPETWLGLLLQHAERDPDVTLIQVAREEEAIGIAATVVVKRWAKERQDATGQPFPTIRAGVGLILHVVVQALG